MRLIQTKRVQRNSSMAFSYVIPIFLHRLLPEALIVKIPFGPLKGYKWLLGSGSFKMLLGVHEKKNTQHIIASLREGQVFFDIGAHAGYFSLIASLCVGPGKVVAFEPSQRNIELLRKNLGMNNINNCAVVKCCIGNENAPVHFDSADDSSTGHIGNQGIIVKMFRLDTLIESHVIDPPGVIKIDVEGAELLVLKGAEKTLEKYCPKVFLSTHSSGLHKKALTFLQLHGYTVVSLGNADLVAMPYQKTRRVKKT